MAGTRSSARLTGNSSSPPSSAKSTGTKRKADESSPATGKAKRGRPSKAAKEQKTLEQTMPETEEAKEEGKQPEVKAEANGGDAGAANGDSGKPEAEDAEAAKAAADAELNAQADAKANDEKPAESVEPDAKQDEQPAKHEDQPAQQDAAEGTSKNDQPATNGDANEPAIEEDQAREKAQPDNVMEKGIIYFFMRGRVGVEDPDSPQDLQRSFFVLRPIPAGGKITDGAIQDEAKNRLIALPKKVWPKSGQDKFMAFVEKSGVSMATLKEEFFQGSDYTTKTTGTRHTPGVTPLGEGVYALTWTGSGRTTNHLSYMLTIPQEMGEVQKDVGLAKQGSFVVSTKNPEQSGQNNPGLSVGAKYPQDVQEEFGTLGWLPTTPAHMDYANAQILLIGESSGIDAVEATQQNAKDDSKETPAEELEKLEHEDEIRIEHLKGDDSIYADLGVSGKDYPSKTTW